jgi:hypothetical protein
MRSLFRKVPFYLEQYIFYNNCTDIAIALKAAFLYNEIERREAVTIGKVRWRYCRIMTVHRKAAF